MSEEKWKEIVDRADMSANTNPDEHHHSFKRDTAIVILWADAELTRLRAIAARCEDVDRIAQEINAVGDYKDGVDVAKIIARAVRDYLLGRK